MMRLTKFLVVTIVVIVLLSGCCNWEDDDMIPVGIPQYAAQVTFVVGSPTAVTGYACNDSMNPADWTSLGPLVGWSWNFGSKIFTANLIVCWDCILRRTNTYYQCIGTGLSPVGSSGWNRYSNTIGADFFLYPHPPGCQDYEFTIYLGTLILELPEPGPAGEIWLLFVCGPTRPQCLWPSVTSPAPV